MIPSHTAKLMPPTTKPLYACWITWLLMSWLVLAIPSVLAADKHVLSAEQFAKDTRVVPIPGHTFSMMEYDVTFELWDACVDDDGCNGYRPNDESNGRGMIPVINVSYDDATAFAEWLSHRTRKHYRLPTDLEWLVAARGGSATAFWWGDSVDCSTANFARIPPGECVSEEKVSIKPVDALPANPYGLYNISGNVWQWVSDCADATCQQHLLRGGSWIDAAKYLRLSFVGKNAPDVHLPVYSFRLVIDQ